MSARFWLCLLLTVCVVSPAAADMFLVKTSEGPGFASPEEAVEVLEKGILPTFDMLLDLQKKKKIVAGGLPVGSRTLYLIVEAESHDEVDRMLRAIPGWGVLSWKVIPLQSLAARAEMERAVVDSIKATQ